MSQNSLDTFLHHCNACLSASSVHCQCLTQSRIFTSTRCPPVFKVISILPRLKESSLIQSAHSCSISAVSFLRAISEHYTCTTTPQSQERASDTTPARLPAHCLGRVCVHAYKRTSIKYERDNDLLMLASISLPQHSHQSQVGDFRPI